MRNLITKLLFAFLLPLFFVACDDEDNDASSSCSVVIDGEKCKIVPQFLGIPGKIFGSAEDWETSYNGREKFWYYDFLVVNSNDDMFILEIEVSEYTLKSGLPLTADNSALSVEEFFDFDFFGSDDEYRLLLSDGNVHVSSHNPKKSTVRFDNAVFRSGSHTIKMNGSIMFDKDSIYDYVD